MRIFQGSIKIDDNMRHQKDYLVENNYIIRYSIIILVGIGIVY